VSLEKEGCRQIIARNVLDKADEDEFISNSRCKALANKNRLIHLGKLK
jgi:hypothetical protein